MLVHGYVRGRTDGKLTVGCYLYDMALRSELVREGWVVPPADWRRAAHKCAAQLRWHIDSVQLDWTH